jgi:hypothetical protein
MDTNAHEFLEAAGMGQSRREALKRFGRYAAVAPTAIVLLQPRDSFARRKKGKKKKGDSSY